MGLVRREDVEAMVAESSAHDGFKVRDAHYGDDHWLHLAFYQNGTAVRPPWLPPDELPLIEVWHKSKLTDADYGEKARLRLVLEALCRFLNTGGDWQQLLAAFELIRRVSGDGVRVNIPGYHLINTEVNTEGVYEHLFAAQDSPWAVRWVEDQFIDVLSLSDVSREQSAADEKYELTHGTPEPVSGPADGEGAGTGLRRLPDPDAAEPDEGGAGQDLP